MRLLFLSNLYPPYDLGGFEQWCQEVAVRLRQHGHIVRVLTSRYGLDRDFLSEADVLRTLHLQADVYHYRPLDFFFKRPGQEKSNERQLRSAISEMAPDLVVVWGMWNLSHCLPYWAEQWMPGRVAYYIASYWPNDLDVHRQYWQLPAGRPVVGMVKRLAGALALSQLRREEYPPTLRFEHTLCCSRYVRDMLVSAGKLPTSAGVLYGGVDPEPFLCGRSRRDGKQAGALRLLYFGSLLPQKGVHTAVQALGLLKQRGMLEQVELTLVGGGHPDYEARLREMALQLGVAERVHFAGRVLRDEIPSRLADFDVFLFTSVWAEPMARTVMEAMAAGLLVIGSEVGGQVEMLTNGQNALTFQAEDADGLASQIVRVLDEPLLRQQLARAGQQMALDKFTLERMVCDIETWLGSIIV